MRFFFYGTLIPGGGNAVACAAQALLRDLGPATTAGTLAAIPDPLGWYPALLPGTSLVHGRLYEATSAFGAGDLARLDAYEDFDPASPARSLYRRTEIVLTGGTKAQAYRFAQPLPPGARSIPDGDFHAWIAREGLRAYGALS